ncbi:MAG: NADH-dependent [FeFe] hydrogenase, group A6 [Candidatus Sumerlaeaceae bacterium]|nr:NADH-dependent [FeFe] hydrogenase, group A6 [Candidatus Sumerlaeaceae bacterium]
MVNITINGKQFAVEEGLSVLEAAKQNNILIPSLCYLEDVHQVGACRICVVEIEGARTLQASCMVQVREGMKVRTNTDKVRKARKMLYELMLSDHPRNCLSCFRNQNCEFQRLGEIIQITDFRFEGEKSKTFVDHSSPSVMRDSSKCILCRRCITVCNQVQGVGVLNVQKRGFKSVIGPADELPLSSVNCTNCGQCIMACPVSALGAKDDTAQVWQALFDPKKRVIVQTAPAVRVALGEEFGLPPGTIVTGKMAAALRELGFDDVFDTNFAADLTIIEEGSEFLQRAEAALKTGQPGALPLVTSCSPGWIKYVEHEFPQTLDHISTCKSPHMMLGALAKTYYAKKIGVAPEDIYVVSIMPCTAKKFEITRPEMLLDGMPTVDAVLTTRELARMIRDAGIDFCALDDMPFDAPLGFSTGAADIFGATGGVMEAALRTVYEIVTGREIPFESLNITPVRGLSQVKEASLTIEGAKPEYAYLEGVTVRVAVTSGLMGAKRLMRQVADGTSPYHFIEIMGCPGGCINGGGQPRPSNRAVREARMKAIYAEDAGKPRRKSHDNPYVQQLYAEFLGTPLGHRSHKLLHTHYTPRGRYNQYLKARQNESAEAAAVEK